jgi:fatty acid-binding protein DegV
MQSAQLAQEIAKQYELVLPETVDEEMLLKVLEQKVVEWIQSGAEEFFQMLYRLDISEKKIKEVLYHEDIAKQIAKLIYERQIQKYNSRLVNKTNAEEKDKDLLW